MEKAIKIIPDNIETMTISHACNTYSHKHFRVYNEGYEFAIVKGTNEEYYLVDTHTYVVSYKYSGYSSVRFLFSDLLLKGFNINLIFNEE